MRNISKLLLLMAITLVISCKKEQKVNTNNSIEQNSIKKNARIVQRAPFQFYHFGTEITESDFLNNAEDAWDEKFAKTEFPLVLALLELYNHPTLLNELVEKANSTPAKCYNLYRFAEEKPEINPIINSIFATRFSDFGNFGNNWKTYLEANYNYDKQYIPFVSLLNRGKINLSKDKYIAGAYEINEEKFTEFRNNIPMWISGIDLSNITTLTEEQAHAIDNPIITISNGFAGDEIKENIDPVDNENTVGQKCNTITHNHEYITHKKFKINERYESTGCSEYTFIWMENIGYDPTNNGWYQYGSPLTGSKSCDVSKNDVGSKTFNWEFSVFSADMFTFGKCFEIDLLPLNQTCHFGVGAYERDWARGWKDLISFCTAGGNDAIQGRRRYTNDYYFFNPGSNSSYPFGIRHPGHHTSYFNTDKGELQLHRWN